MDVNVLTNTVAPLLGTIICVLMYSSPVRAVMQARKECSLGRLNSIPFGLAFVNAISWCMYAIMLKDYYIFLANSPGVVCGMYCVVSSLVIMGANSEDAFSNFNFRVLENILLGGVSFFLVLGMVVGITMSAWDEDLKNLVVALIANTACVMYYGAPCSSMYEVIMTKDSSSLHLPMIFVNFLNAILWSVYGFFALHDLFVVVPNSIGLCLSLMQLCLIMTYPARNRADSGSSAGAAAAIFIGRDDDIKRGESPLLDDELYGVDSDKY